MAVYNTGSDAANTMIRAFLTKVGELYLGHTFSTHSGKGKEIWTRIKTERFNEQCAYCNEVSETLTIEHLVMFNRDQCGLHHPGNIVPCCKKCNRRGYNPEEKRTFTWQEQLEQVCEDQGVSIQEFSRRKRRILESIKGEAYPDLTDDEINALRAVARSLYDRVSSELGRAIDLFQDIDSSLVQRRGE